MKITAKQYAFALYDLTEGKNQKEISIVLASFSELLKKNNAFSKLDAILAEFNTIWNSENSIIEASVISAKGLDKTSKKAIIDYIKKVSDVGDVVLEEGVDKNILGGVIVKYGDKIVDSSLRGRVESLGRSLEK